MPVQNSGAPIARTDKVEEGRVVIGKSVNIEVVFEARLPQDLGGCVAGEKNLVDSIVMPIEEDDPYVVTTTAGRTISIHPLPDQTIRRFAAGTSLNLARNLLQLGVNPVSLIATIGHGKTGTSLIADLKRHDVARGLEYAAFAAAETAITLNVWDSRHKRNGSTLFCLKPPEVDSPELQGFFYNCAAQVLALTGVKSGELQMMENAFASRAQRKVFAPHPEFLHWFTASQVFRERVRAAVQKANLDLVHMNRSEASIIVGEQFVAETRLTAKLDDLLPAQIIIVTQDHDGAVAIFDEGRKFEPKAAFPVQTKGTRSGAGDAHLAGFIKARFLEGFSIRDALFMASWVASRKLEEVGPSHGIPTAEEWETQIAALTPAARAAH